MTILDEIKQLENLDGQFVYLGGGDASTLDGLLPKLKPAGVKLREVHLLSEFKERKWQLAVDTINKNKNLNKVGGNLYRTKDISELGKLRVACVFVSGNQHDTINDSIEKAYTLVQNLGTIVVDRNKTTEELFLKFVNEKGIKNQIKSNQTHLFIKKTSAEKKKVVRSQTPNMT